MAPIVNGLEMNFEDQIAFQHLDVNQPAGQLLSQAYQVRSHPTLLLLDTQGDVLWKHVGIISEADLAQAIIDVTKPVD